jgi:3D (Asp-Asp-Asp) domain-containing protein
LNGVTYVTRKPTIKSAIAADTAVISAFGLVTMAANDYIQLTVASDTTGNLLISDANMTLRLIRATA